MSKLLLNLVLGSTKVVVNSWTLATLPLYTIAQRPWTRLKRSRSFGLRSSVDKYQRTVYSRPCAARHFAHPALHCKSFNEMVPTLAVNRRVIASREVLSESSQVDAISGLPIKVDGRELKRIELSDHLRWLTVGDVMERVDALARSFQHTFAMKKGEKVALYADNSFEWFCCALALQRINAVTITLLSILNTDSLVYSLNQSESRYLITSQELLQKKVNSVACKLTSIQSVIYIENKLPANNTQTEDLQKVVLNLKEHHQLSVEGLQKVEAVGKAMPACEFAIPHPQDVALVMYTSGTTGNQAKGVMMTHENIATGLHNLLYYDAELEYPLLKSRFASFLPMSHIFGYMLNLGLFIDKGEIVFCSPHTLFDSSPAHVPGQIGDLKLIQPEYISLVPLVLDRILKEINRKLEAKSPLAMPLFEYLMDYKIKWRSRGYQAPIIDRVICKKLNEQFGGNLKTITVGSAPLNPRTQALVQAALNIRCTQGYGSTEMTAGATIMHNDDLTYGASGVPFNSAKFYLKDWSEGNYFSTDRPNPRGEVIVGGANITSGYYKMDEETAESFKVDADGQRWFESGDIGELLPNGTLKIIDRKKDLTKLSNGEFVSLGKIESALRSSAFVENIAICTSPTANYVVALIQPNRQAIDTLVTEKLQIKSVTTFEEQCSDEQVKKAVLQDLNNVGKGRGLCVKELPVRVHLATVEWTQDNHLMTAALKLRRKQVNEYYAREIEQLFR